MKHVKVDKEVCIGCGFCFSNLDKVFKQGDDGLAETIKEDVEKELEEEVEEIADGCPVTAIKIEN